MKDNGLFECQVGARPAEGLALGLRAFAGVSVLVPPSNMSLEGVKEGGRAELEEGTSLSVACRTVGSRPEPTIGWYKDGRRLTGKSLR